MPPRLVAFPLTISKEPCGVEDFSRRLVAAASDLNDGNHYVTCDISSNWKSIAKTFWKADQIIYNLPLVAWKRMICTPLITLAFAMLARRPVILILHEWRSLHPLRRLLTCPFILASRSILLMSPTVKQELQQSIFGRMAAKCSLIPIAPNICRPDHFVVTERVRQIERVTKNSEIRIGYFGSIYSGKRPEILLDVCQLLRNEGTICSVIYIGSVIRSAAGYEDQFAHEITKRNLKDCVALTEYVANEEELFAFFEHIDVFVFVLPEGLSAKRASILTCVQTGRPVLVSAPKDPAEFYHHLRYSALIESGIVSFIPQSASIADIGALVRKCYANRNAKPYVINYPIWWRDTANAVAHAAAQIDGRFSASRQAHG